MHPLVLRTCMRAAGITGAEPVGYYSLALSTALISPFTLSLTAVITPPTALLKQTLYATTLNHRFCLLL